jgi:hypothetical protein
MRWLGVATENENGEIAVNQKTFTLPTSPSGWDDSLIAFAHSFNGYEFAEPTLVGWPLFEQMRTRFEDEGFLPDDIELLRFALFMASRNDYAAGGGSSFSEDFATDGFITRILEQLQSLGGSKFEEGPGSARLTSAQLWRVRNVRRLDPPQLTTAWWDVLKDGMNLAISNANPGLPYLCLTSKPEAVLRDAAAWILEQGLSDPLFVAREWSPHPGSGRIDLAIVRSTDDQPPQTVMAAEIKVFGLLEQIDGIKPRHADVMLADIRSLRRLAEEERSRGNFGVTPYFVLVHQTHRNLVPERLRKVVKYANKSNASLHRAGEHFESVRSFCNHMAEVWLNEQGVATHHGWTQIDAGEHWGIGVNLDILVGQV